MSYKLVIDKKHLEISEADWSGHYYVHWDNLMIGYVYIAAIDDGTGKYIWAGSTLLLNSYAEILGTYIEKCAL
jgi:hypothetical protein